VPAHRRISGPRWIAYYSNLDLLVPMSSAMIRHPDLQATNVFVKDHGHLSTMVSPLVARSLVHQLEWAEGVAGTGSLVPMPTAVHGASGDVDVDDVVAVGD